MFSLYQFPISLRGRREEGDEIHSWTCVTREEEVGLGVVVVE